MMHLYPSQEETTDDENEAMNHEEIPPKINGKLIIGIGQKNASLQAMLTGEDGAEISLFEIRRSA